MGEKERLEENGKGNESGKRKKKKKKAWIKENTAAVRKFINGGKNHSNQLRVLWFYVTKNKKKM